MTNNQLVIIRGLPGSGKSTLARTIAKEYGHVFIETDMFFETPTGYVFDRTRLPDAVAWATAQVRSLILQGPVVTTGVFTKVSSWAYLADLSSNTLVIECVGQSMAVSTMYPAGLWSLCVRDGNRSLVQLSILRRLTMSDWSVVRHIPMYVPGVVAKLTGVVHKLVGQEPSGYWAEFRLSDNPNYVSIRSYSGKFEDECHGAFYHLRDARAYYRRLRQAGFLTLTKEVCSGH